MKNKKGFTLAELLVVVAIIAVLVAISIPIFSTKLHDAKVATDWANLRTFYAQMKVEMIDSDDYSFLDNYNAYPYFNNGILPSNTTSLTNNKGFKVKFVGGSINGVIGLKGHAKSPLFLINYKCDKDCPKHKVSIYYGYKQNTYNDKYSFVDSITWGS